MSRIFLLIRNMFVLTTLSPKVAKFLWNECPVKIVRSSNEGAWYWFKNDGSPIKIELGPETSRKILYTGLLHEVGHYRDALKLKNKFKKMSDGKNSPKTLEKTAWKWAIVFSKQYDIPIDFVIAQKWLSSYEVNYRCLDNKVARMAVKK